VPGPVPAHLGQGQGRFAAPRADGGLLVGRDLLDPCVCELDLDGHGGAGLAIAAEQLDDCVGAVLGRHDLGARSNARNGNEPGATTWHAGLVVRDEMRGRLAKPETATRFNPRS